MLNFCIIIKYMHCVPSVSLWNQHALQVFQFCNQPISSIDMLWHCALMCTILSMSFLITDLVKDCPFLQFRGFSWKLPTNHHVSSYLFMPYACMPPTYNFLFNKSNPKFPSQSNIEFQNKIYNFLGKLND